MTTNDELVRLRKAFAAPAGTVPEPEACPPSDRIWLAVRGELPPDELREIVDHVATCPACAEDWRIAMAFEEESRAGIVTPVPARRFQPWLAAAAVILVSVVGLQLQGPRPRPEYRGNEQAGVQSLVEDKTLPRDRFVLRWTPAPEAESYTLQVSSSNLDPLFNTEVTTTSYTVPESALAHLEPGTRILWTVTPVARGGGLLQQQTFSTRLK
jgi:hypothetical protein